ncbi:MAG TPA: DUF4397 domain-containing protein [Candidatus Aquilonibacter sp.]|nr:DUF4397 domain-containing protein [Candidatus Aquilonibacter sp.]
MFKNSIGRAVTRAATIALMGGFGLSLAACNGGSNSVPGFGTNNGYFRFVNGSADAGAVDVYVDGQKVNSSGPVAYGSVTAYNQYSAGSHTITVNVAGTSTAISLPSSSTTQGVNGGSYVSLVLTGEVHPVNASDTLNLIAINDTNLFNTTKGGMGVNFHNAAPLMGQTQFGYYLTNTPAQQSPLGSPVNVGQETLQGIPSTALASNINVGFYATSGATTVTETPSQVDPTGCAANTLPCNTGNLSLYLIDGPAASSAPAAGPYPQGITASQASAFVGIFDQNGV